MGAIIASLIVRSCSDVWDQGLERYIALIGNVSVHSYIKIWQPWTSVSLVFGLIVITKEPLKLSR